MNPLQRLFSRRPPALDWIQLEVTSHCNAACVYCPQGAYREHWRRQHLPLEAIDALRPALRRAGLVFLQGWGEPLMYPRFMELLGLLKAAGCRVGTTSNATLLTPDTTARLIDAGLDILAVSLAGLRASRNDAIRKGTSLQDVLDALRTAGRIKAQRGCDSPALHVAYLLLASGLDEIGQLPEALAGLGVDQVVVSSLSLVVKPELAGEAVLAGDAERFARLRDELFAVRDRASRQGLNVHFQIASRFARPGPCPENVRRSVFIGADGRVFPCVFAGIPVQGPCTHQHGGAAHPLPEVCFGNVFEAPLGRLWRDRAFRGFREHWASSDPTPGCTTCLKRAVAPLVAAREQLPLVP